MKEEPDHQKSKHLRGAQLERICVQAKDDETDTQKVRAAAESWFQGICNACCWDSFRHSKGKVNLPFKQASLERS
jgi:hypothetical protein